MPPPPPPIPPLLGRIIEPLYTLAITTRNRRFDASRGVTRLPIPIISVGNLSVGGTGKTPMVALLIAELRAAGHNPCIAMRGYQPRGGRRARKRTAAPAISDEAELYKQTFPDLPIIAQPDRTAGLKALLASPKAEPIDVVVLDDGFQHRQLARDLDIVLIDASRSPFNDHLLPRGWLREPPSSLRRAHAVVITHAELADPVSLAALEAAITRAHGNPPTAITRHAWTSLSILDPTSNTDTKHAPSHLRGKRTLTVCAIGNPDGFLATVREVVGDPSLLTSMVLPDHDPYAPSTVAVITRAASSADVIVTTEKDWTKLSRLPASTWPCPVARPHLALTFDRGHEALLSLALTVARNRNSSTPPGR